MPHRACGPFLLALLLGACGDGSKPSAEENEQLNNASEMLDEAENALAEIDDNLLREPEGNSARP
jgi:hypothetical protein